jgi:hypothetical protein
VIWSVLTNRLVRKKVDPAVQNTVEGDMNVLESPFREMVAPTLADMFVDTSGAATTTGISTLGMES